MFKSGFVAIIGRPNAGKSTLLNAILGAELSIVTPKAQTTRERVLGILTEDRGQIVFIDTPGIHRAKEGSINAFMVNEAKEAAEGPNAIWYIVDPASLIAGVKHETVVMDILKEIAGSTPVFLLVNKLDRLGKDTREKVRAARELLEGEIRERGIQLQAVFEISALKKKGLKELLSKTWEVIPEGPLYYPDADQLSDRPTRFFAAEKIREQLFLKLGAEIPYSCAVEIEKFEEPRPEEKKPLTRIEAVIYVERDSQKGIVVGKGGQKIKEIGQAARLAIEEFLAGGPAPRSNSRKNTQKPPVFLGLRVKVLKDWSKDAEALKKMGYFLPEKA
jgi:GTP-binding protein Era